MIAKCQVTSRREAPAKQKANDDERQWKNNLPAGIEIHKPCNNGQEREKELSRGRYYEAGREQSYSGRLDEDPWMLDDG